MTTFKMNQHNEDAAPLEPVPVIQGTEVEEIDEVVEVPKSEPVATESVVSSPSPSSDSDVPVATATEDVEQTAEVNENDETIEENSEEAVQSTAKKTSKMKCFWLGPYLSGEKKMSKKRKIVVIVCIVILIALLGFSLGFRFYSDYRVSQINQQIEEEKAALAQRQAERSSSAKTYTNPFA